MDDFIQSIEWKHQMLGIHDDDAIVNANETKVHFLPEFECTIAARMSKLCPMLNLTLPPVAQ